MELVDAIKRAFAQCPYPGSRRIDISATTYDDEGIYDYFVGSDPFDHEVTRLRYHSVALSFFTDPAFRYWLPAFMIAELTDPIKADIIAESIAYHLSDARGAHAKIISFSEPELEAAKMFFHECIRRYPDDIGSSCFCKALEKIEKAERGGRPKQ